MNFSTSPPEEPELNLTPLIDVVFILLIFFVVSTTFDRRGMIEVQLPQASEQEAAAPSDALLVLIDRDGRYFVGNNEVINTLPATLREAIERSAGDDRSQQVTIRADANTPHQSVVTAMDVLGKLGFNNLSIATVQSADE